MPGDFLTRTPQLTMRQFHALRDDRPKEEKWELIDGVAVEKVRCGPIHARIASNIERLMNSRLGAIRPEWQAERSVSVWPKGEKRFNPEPDVTVIDAAIAMGQIYVRRFYFVAEVLSESDKKAVLQAKLAYYQQHEHNRGVLFVHQDRVDADQHDRGATGWCSRRLRSPAAPLTFADIGTIGRLGDLYRFTPLDPFTQH